MLALGPRDLGSKLNLDEIQFFLDFCNSQIINSDPFTSVLLPQFKVVVMTMEVHGVRVLPDREENFVRKVNLSVNDRKFVEKAYTTSGWFTTFTNRELIEGSIPNLNVESADVLQKILATISPDYTGPIFLLGTLKFDTPENSMVPKPVSEEELQQTLDTEAKKNDENRNEP